jgi:hypothetical protein
MGLGARLLGARPGLPVAAAPVDSWTGFVAGRAPASIQARSIASSAGVGRGWSSGGIRGSRVPDTICHKRL